MKKAVRVLLAIILIALTVLFSLFFFVNVLGDVFFGAIYLSELSYKNSHQTVPLDYVAEDLQLDLTHSEVIENRDTHGGWLGDGESIVLLSFTPEEYTRLEEQLTEHWQPLPLTENLNRCLNFEGIDGEPLLTPAEQGYYYFYDRHNESLDPYDDTDLFSRPSYNFTLAILDSDSHTLQYLRFDT